MAMEPKTNAGRAKAHPLKTAKDGAAILFLAFNEPGIVFCDFDGTA